MIKVFISFVFMQCFVCPAMQAQKVKPTYAPHTTKQEREKEYKYLIGNSIHKNLQVDLADSTEESWQDAFSAMELLNYRSSFIDTRIQTAMDAVEKRSIGFQRALLEMVYALYAKDFITPVTRLSKQTVDPKLFAMCAEYLLQYDQKGLYNQVLLKRTRDLLQAAASASDIALLTVINNKLELQTPERPPLQDLLAAGFLPGEMVVYSFQRKNRNYPGLVMVRGRDGKFIKDPQGKHFAVPQLARSCSNMPGYITHGNTPQGIFKIFGFAVSKSSFIGPTENIQMVLPYENSMDVSDSVTRSLGDNYRFLLPVSWKNYFPVYEAYYAGKAGRTEIIAHGTTVNPEYYKKQIYYPLTPTQGCLCTKEIWNTIDGKRLESDQQKLVNAVNKAGGANGYCIVIEIDDQQRPVSLKDISPFLK